jgi:SsrA-binding protein
LVAYLCPSGFSRARRFLTAFGGSGRTRSWPFPADPRTHAGTVGKPDKSEKAMAIQPIVRSRRASFDYELTERFECGIVLVGSEVKSLREGKVELVDAWAGIEGRELWLKQLQIAPFVQATAYPHEPRRARKLLVHRNEIEKIQKLLDRGGFTLVPLALYFKEGRVKVELALGKGKKTVDKRHVLAEKTASREARSEMERARKEGR